MCAFYILKERFRQRAVHDRERGTVVHFTLSWAGQVTPATICGITDDAGVAGTTVGGLDETARPPIRGGCGMACARSRERQHRHHIYHIYI